MTPRECAACVGTGKTRRGGPCRFCRGTGHVQGADATLSTMNAVGHGIQSFVWSAFAFVFIIFVLVAVLH